MLQHCCINIARGFRESMAGGGGISRSLEETPTWAVAGVYLVLVIISIIIEHIILLFGEYLKRHHKAALYEALEKIKSELMLLGFISLLLTAGQGPISKICVSKSIGDSWHPCNDKNGLTAKSTKGHYVDSDGNATRRRLLKTDEAMNTFSHALAGGGSSDKCAAKGKVSLISTDGIHQLHIFIFVLAVIHVMYCISTIALSRLKMKKWKAWELESKASKHQFSNDQTRFTFARETSFRRRHFGLWSNSAILIWIVCFFRQFSSSVTKLDYLALRQGFIMAHLAPQSSSRFDFQKYIKRSLGEDVKVVVGISPVMWLIAVLFLLSNFHGLHSYLWLPFVPLIIVLLVGTKLQVIITRMAIQVTARGDAAKGVPVVQPTDELFWFRRPNLLLFLIHFILFQNAFQLAFLIWSWYEFGYPSCFHQHVEDIIIRIFMSILIQVVCSYITLPLYALVTQMGSTMKPAIFNESVATALKKWHQTARKHLRENQKSGSEIPMTTSMQSTPKHGLSPVHLLQSSQSDLDNLKVSPRQYIVKDPEIDLEGSFTPSNHTKNYYSPKHPSSESQVGLVEERRPMHAKSAQIEMPSASNGDNQEITISLDFTFDNRKES